MNIPKFNEITSLSNAEISEAIMKTENELFQLTFKKVTQQNFKSHEIKYAKRKIAQLKTLLTLRLQELEK